jgi:chemotaxis regulatin CheY-phosphate phosphatase CheZ
MNKIERAISDLKLHLGNLKMDKVILNFEISAFEKQLEALESIERNKSIPHSNTIIEVTKEEILKKRWQEWEEYNKDNFDLSNECTFTDGFTRGSLWMQKQLSNQKN